MKPEAQRIAIAEACGYSAEQWESGGWMLSRNGDRVHHPLDGTGSRETAFTQHAPDYLNDLSAMHEAEKALGFDQRLNYPAILFDVVCRTSGPRQQAFNKIHPDAWAIQATAAQRAEAFLKTLGKWEGHA